MPEDTARKSVDNKISSLATSALAVTAGLSALTVPNARSEGGEIVSMSRYNDHLALAQNYPWAAAVTRVDHWDNSPSTTMVASVVAIAPNVILTAGHFTPRDNSTVAQITEVTFGSNYNTSTDKYEVARTMRFPSYVFGDTNTIDLGIIWTKELIKGFDTPVKFASANVGDVLTMVDYGNYGDVTTGELPSLGDKMAGYAPVVNNSTGEYPSSLYAALYFTSSGSNGPLNISGKPFSSGSPWYETGDLAALTIAGTNSFGGGYTRALRLDNPDIQTFLNPIVSDSWDLYEAAQSSVPEPSAAVGGLALLAGLAMKRQRHSL